ncbi:MAG: efflux RND transporter periplasmic adaptor subunit [Candidatus Aminicenantes bacterium]|nr:efflux RND transporter periplasmic adaptor subunit [Candidatus Aminicenantes bacterium]
MGTCSPLPGPAGNKTKVTGGDFFQTVLLTGSIQARKAEHFVVPRTSSWQIQIKWMVREGDSVKPGDPVVRFDNSNMTSDIENIEMNLRNKLEQKKQKLAEYHHQTKEVEFKVKQAEIEYEKKKLDAAISEGIISKFEYDKKQLELRKSEEALKKARVEKEVKLATLDSELKRLSIDIKEERDKLHNSLKTLESLTLKAETGGTVVYTNLGWPNRRKVQVGDNVSASETVATIPDRESLQVEAWVNESDINRVKPGQRVDIFMDAYPDKGFSGTIKDVLNNAEKKQFWGKARYFNIFIELDTRDFSIMKPGMSVKCLAHSTKHLDVLLIPIQMAYFDGRVFFIKPQGKKTVKVEPLGFNEFYLAVNKNGTLKEGTLLETVNPSKIKEIGNEND